MTKSEFLAQLGAALAALPADERDEAMRYYNDYFDESGLGEAEVVSRLGTPSEVADTILRDFYTGSEKSWNTKIPYENPSAGAAGASPAGAPSDDRSFRGTLRRIGAVMPAWAWILLAFVSIPVWGPILLSAVGVVFGTLCAVFGILLSLCFIVVALVGAGVAALASGLVTLFTSPPASLVIIGGGVLLIALGTLLSIPTIWLWSLVPKFFRYVFAQTRRAFSAGKGATA
ncbi:MAG TPA: DUF1700 domain-containing protein [Candidatus Acidoferrum sp.]|nr:DUF1700 domain-containing protein [Candidatus Acidoferrum sp.]